MARQKTKPQTVRDEDTIPLNFKVLTPAEPEGGWLPQGPPPTAESTPAEREEYEAATKQREDAQKETWQRLQNTLAKEREEDKVIREERKVAKEKADKANERRERVAAQKAADKAMWKEAPRKSRRVKDVGEGGREDGEDDMSWEIPSNVRNQIPPSEGVDDEETDPKLAVDMETQDSAAKSPAKRAGTRDPTAASSHPIEPPESLEGNAKATNTQKRKASSSPISRRVRLIYRPEAREADLKREQEEGRWDKVLGSLGVDEEEEKHCDNLT